MYLPGFYCTFSIPILKKKHANLKENRNSTKTQETKIGAIIDSGLVS